MFILVHTQISYAAHELLDFIDQFHHWLISVQTLEDEHYKDKNTSAIMIHCTPGLNLMCLKCDVSDMFLLHTQSIPHLKKSHNWMHSMS
jgi:hypothetical protein